ncbi:MAG TPA: hypothetical protein VK910_08235 [Thiobacillus sp.]|nr:hypothetical protein [Thiobacillus sp.]
MLHHAIFLRRQIRPRFQVSLRVPHKLIRMAILKPGTHKLPADLPAGKAPTY